MAKASRKIPIDKLNLRKEIKRLLAEITRMDAAKIKETDNIRDDLGVDSLMAMEVLAAIEKRLDIRIDEAKVFDVVTVKDLINLVVAYIRKK